jgi:hypothetical protein
LERRPFDVANYNYSPAYHIVTEAGTLRLRLKEKECFHTNVSEDEERGSTASPLGVP